MPDLIYTPRVELVIPPLQSWAIYKQRQLSEITSLMFHRIGPSLHCQKKECLQEKPLELEDAAGIAAWFKTHGIAQIGSPKMPYSFVIPAAGPRVYQAVPLSCVTPHAQSWNRRSVSVAFIGDFRREPPTAWQIEAAKQLSLRIQDTLGRVITMERHSLAPGGTTDPKGHECPGSAFRSGYLQIEAHVRDSFHITK